MIVQMNMDGNEMARFSSANTAARATGCNKGAISRCCRGILHSHHGFKWKKEVSKEKQQATQAAKDDVCAELRSLTDAVFKLISENEKLKDRITDLQDKAWLEIVVNKRKDTIASRAELLAAVINITLGEEDASEEVDDHGFVKLLD